MAKTISMTAPTTHAPHHHLEKAIVTDTFGRTEEDYKLAADWLLETQKDNYITQYIADICETEKINHPKFDNSNFKL
jgi:hypothetical protein